MNPIALVLALVAVGASPTIDRFFADFSAKRDHIDRLEARFSQETITPDETTHSAGYIVYQRPRRIMIRYTDSEFVYLIDGNRVYQYDAEYQQVQVYDLDNDPQLSALFLGFDDDTARLREAYTVSLFDADPASCGTKGLRLTPAAIRNAQGIERPASEETPLFQSVELYLRAGDYLPCQIHVTNEADSQVEISVTDFKINEAAGDASAQINVPEGTTIIENEVLVETVGPGGKRIPETPAVSSENMPPANPAPDAPANASARP